MKKRLIILCVIQISLFSRCTVQKDVLIGQYVSDCILYNEPNLLLQLNNDEKFAYSLAMLEDTVYGTWHLSNDTLILSSKYFSDEYKETRFSGMPVDLTPSFKFTDRKDVDIYLVKRKKLYPIDKTGQIKDCILNKIR